METKDLKYCYKYPHPSVTTDCVVLGWDGKKLHVLLIERGREPYKGCWAFPGGFLNMDESAEEGAARELQEETGLQGIPLRQFHTFSQPGRDPRERVITIAYYAVIRWQKIQAGDDAARAQWFPLDAIPALAFDHRLGIRPPTHFAYRPARTAPANLSRGKKFPANTAAGLFRARIAAN